MPLGYWLRSKRFSNQRKGNSVLPVISITSIFTSVGEVPAGKLRWNIPVADGLGVMFKTVLVFLLSIAVSVVVAMIEGTMVQVG